MENIININFLFYKKKYNKAHLHINQNYIC
jgi:hypothetical protein